MIPDGFEWDEEKNKANIKKHNINFETAYKVFYDSNALFLDDNVHSTDEERYIVLGRVREVLFVVCTDRTNGNIRLISARLADKNEQEAYYGNC